MCGCGVRRRVKVKVKRIVEADEVKAGKVKADEIRQISER